MRNQLEQFKTLFDQVRGLGIVMKLPNGNHTELSKNINVWFAENYNVTGICFGKYDDKIEFMRYSRNDTYIKVSFDYNITDEKLQEVFETVTSEYNEVKMKYFDEFIVNQLIEESIEEATA